MPAADDDWRIRSQERYLQGAVLRFAPYRTVSPAWDHDHCAFCWAKFIPDESVGYTTTGEYLHGADYTWICPTCFTDFKERFEWIVIAADL